MSIKSKINKIELPKTDSHFQRSSIDGYAWLGWARELVGLDTSEIEEIMETKAYGLNDKYNILGTPLPPDTIYAYSCYPAFEFYRAIGRQDRVDNIIYWLDNIGTYDNGMMRYCTVETNYMVPNVTPLAALAYLKHGRSETAINLINTLRERQENGNWRYYKDWEPKSVEDSMHLAMMVYALREIDTGALGIETSDMVTGSVEQLDQMNDSILQTGTVGWNPPWLAVALHEISEFKNIYDRAYKKTYTHTIANSNFRVQAMSAWALAYIENKKESEDR